MAVSRHRTTRRGTQKQRARTHHAYLNAAHPQVTAEEFRHAMLLANVHARQVQSAPHKRGDFVTFADGTRYQVTLSGAWVRQEEAA